jgi:hypothetical protein
MLAVNTYPDEYIASCQSPMKAQRTAYRTMASVAAAGDAARAPRSRHTSPSSSTT